MIRRRKADAWEIQKLEAAIAIPIEGVIAQAEQQAEDDWNRVPPPPFDPDLDLIEWH